MTSRLYLIPCILLSLLLSGCLTARSPAPVVDFGAGKGPGSAGAHLVLEGDTLFKISERYKLAIRDIAHKNNLYPPFRLNVGERLNLPPPRSYRVREGDTLYRVSRLFGVETSEVARLNKMRAPYTLREGQSLRLPSAVWEEDTPQQIASAAAPDFSYKEAKPLKANAPASVKAARLNEPKAVRTKITAKTPKRSSSKFLRPVDGKVLSNYGPKKSGLHNDGINIAAPKGAPVRAAENGVVVYAGNELKGSGNLVLVRHDGRYMTAYAHLDRTLIKRGATVKRGQTIGTVGTSGSVSTPQLHFEVRKGTRAINPTRYLSS